MWSTVKYFVLISIMSLYSNVLKKRSNYKNHIYYQCGSVISENMNNVALLNSVGNIVYIY